MTTNDSESWEEIGESAVTEMKITPEQVGYVEARGFLCHELVHILGGYIEFVETPWKHFILKTLELIFPILPICRWFPPENSALEWVGYHPQLETKVYRMSADGDPPTVFFVEYRPEAPAWGRYIHPLFKVPMLDISKFLRPSFDKDYDNLKNEQILRSGMEERFTRMPMTAGAKDRLKEMHLATCKGLWQGFSKK